MKISDQKMTQFISRSSLKVMYGEMVGLLFILFCGISLIDGLFFSSINRISIFGFTISGYYIFPVMIASFGYLYLIPKHIFIYRKVITSFILKENKIIFFVLGRRKEMNNFKILTDKNNTFKPWTYWDVFTKKKVNYIVIRHGQKDYILPFVEKTKDNLIFFLIKNGGRLD